MNIYTVLFLLFFPFVLSCSTSHDVVHKGFLHKRKYKKGYNLSFKKRVIEKKSKANEDLIVAEKSGALEKEEGVYSDSLFLNKKLLSQSTKQDQLVASLDYHLDLSETSILERALKDEKKWVNTSVKDERGVGANKILIKKIKAFTLMTMISFVLYLVLAVLVLFSENLILSIALLGLLLVLLFAFFSAIKYLVIYVKNKYEKKDDLSSRENSRLRYVKRLNSLSKIVLLLLALLIISIVLLFLFPVALQGSFLFALFFFLVSVHYFVFFIITIVSFVISLILSSKEMKKDLGKKKISNDDYYNE